MADRDGNYLVLHNEQLGYRYEVVKVIDTGAFGQVILCVDHKDPKKRYVAAKISKNKKFDVDNANVEIKILKKLNTLQPCENILGHDKIVVIKDNFKFR